MLHPLLWRILGDSLSEIMDTVVAWVTWDMAPERMELESSKSPEDLDCILFVNEKKLFFRSSLLKEGIE